MVTYLHKSTKKGIPYKLSMRTLGLTCRNIFSKQQVGDRVSASFSLRGPIVPNADRAGHDGDGVAFPRWLRVIGGLGSWWHIDLVNAGYIRQDRKEENKLSCSTFYQWITISYPSYIYIYIYNDQAHHHLINRASAFTPKRKDIEK